MKHIQNKHDWTYELRPQILILISLFGILNQFTLASQNTDLMFLSIPSVMILLGCAYKISSWRRDYRRRLL